MIFLSTGLTGTEILFAQVITQFTIMAGQTIMVLIVSFAIFDITCEGNIGLIGLLTILTGLCGMCLGMNHFNNRNNYYYYSFNRLNLIFRIRYCMLLCKRKNRDLPCDGCFFTHCDVMWNNLACRGNA